MTDFGKVEPDQDHAWVFKDMQCPVCGSAIRAALSELTCAAEDHRFPIVRGVPVVLNNASSVFQTTDYLSGGVAPERGAAPWRSVLRYRPSIGMNIGSSRNFQRLNELLTSRACKQRVLVLGGRVLGSGLDLVANNDMIELLESDVATGPRTRVIFDAHDIPYRDASFDAVVVQAVLEHVCDPYRCVDEIHRVLRPDGLVYSETPFMQQVHGKAWDFTRFTDLGHRRLFRKFEEIDRGICGGPGMALAWSWTYFLQSLSDKEWLRRLARVIGHFSGFWLKYFDPLVIRNRGAQDAASGFYFLGKSSNRILSDRDLIKLWRGGEG